MSMKVQEHEERTTFEDFSYPASSQHTVPSKRNIENIFCVFKG